MLEDTSSAPAVEEGDLATGGSTGSSPAPAAEPEDPFNFDQAFQSHVAACMLRETQFLNQVGSLIKPDYFENEADRFVSAVVLDHFKTYGKAPGKSVVATVFKDALEKKKVSTELKADVKKKLGALLKADLSDRDMAVDKVASFAKAQALTKAMTASIEALQRNDFSQIEKLMSAAFVVGAAGAGTMIDYWSQTEIEARTKRRDDMAKGLIKPDGITTGHGDLDTALLPHLGWGRKELSVILGAAKAGKSMSLGEFAKNASLEGYNVFYGSWEVGAHIIADRTDSNVARIAMKLLNGRALDVEAALKSARANAGKLCIHEFATGTTSPNDLKALLERYRAKGIVFDLIVVDYADIMAPNFRVEETRDNLREIYIGLRELAFIYNAAVLTATQTNREGAKSATAKATDVAEDFNKVRTCDVMIGINATEDEVAAGEARLRMLAMRNGESGYTLRIEQDRSCMRFLTKVIGRE